MKNHGMVTLKDISRELGVSSVSVHRALRGKEGISDELREKIKKAALEMGYVENYAAASMKRKTGRIAVVIPEDKWEKKLYFDYIWQGINKSAEEMRGLNIEIVPFICNNEEKQREELKKIADEGISSYMGVITFSFTRAKEVLIQIQRLLDMNIKVLVIDDDLKEPEGVLCILPREKKVGKVAAELGALITPEQGRVLVSSGRIDSKIHLGRVESFCQYLKENKPDLKIEIIEGYSRSMDYRGKLYHSAYAALEKYDDVCLMYALTSHDNIALVEACEQLGKRDKIRIIGTDFNEETRELLINRRMEAVIDQNPFQKGYQAFKVMADSIVKYKSLPELMRCRIDIVMRNNVENEEL